MDTPRPAHLVRPGRRARFLASALAAGLTLAIALPVAASTVVVWSGFQGDPSHSGFAADGPAPPYVEAWTSPAELGGASAQFGLSQPVVVDDTVVTVGTEAIVGVDLATGDQVWTVARDAGPAGAPAALTVGDTVAIAYTEGFGPHPPGSRVSASASASATASASPSARGSAASGEPDGGPVDSHLAAIDIATQEPLWKPVALDAVSDTGVTATDGVAYAATEAGSVYAVDLRTGDATWTADAGEAVDTPLIVTDGLVIAVTRATSDEPSSVVALDVSDGSETWRWNSDTPVYRLSAASADDAHVYVGLSDQNGTLRALDLGTGSLAWTARMNAAVNLVSAPAATGDAVYALDFRGQLYRFDPATGTRDWDFALNELVLRSGPVVVGDHVVFGTTSGHLVAVEAGSGDLVWQAESASGQLRSIAVTPDRLVAVRGGEDAGLIAFDTDPAGALVRVPSPTVLDPGGFFGAFAIGALVFCAIAILGGRWLIGRAGPALATETEGSGDDGPADPFDEDDESDEDDA
ncbi:MAG: outer membrane protein assembly factor BamB family protein [Actinomycetota bacterium]